MEPSSYIASFHCLALSRNNFSLNHLQGSLLPFFFFPMSFTFLRYGSTFGIGNMGKSLFACQVLGGQSSSKSLGVMDAQTVLIKLSH